MVLVGERDSNERPADRSRFRKVTPKQSEGDSGAWRQLLRRGRALRAENEIPRENRLALDEQWAEHWL